jgi:predicted amidophosphoribosyltransferase
MARSGSKPRHHTAKHRASRRRYASRVAESRCAWCPRWAVKDRILCKRCRDRSVGYQRAMLARRRAVRLCRECGLHLDTDGSRCKKCRHLRKLRPSRQNAYRRRNERGYADRSR